MSLGKRLIIGLSMLAVLQYAIYLLIELEQRLLWSLLHGASVFIVVVTVELIANKKAKK